MVGRVTFSTSDQQRMERFAADVTAAEGIIESLVREANMLAEVGAPCKRTISRLVAAKGKLQEARYCWDYDVVRGYGVQTKKQREMQVQHELS